MKLLLSINAIIIGGLLIISQAFAQQAPQERNTFQINRMMTNGVTANGQLSKNTFKVETYQAPYTVQVPYTENEEYDVEVPYTDYEDYDVEIPYQTQESYYENVPYTRSVSYTDTETYYENDYQCREVTRTKRECRTETQCYIIPGESSGPVCQDVEECGFNAQGERICKTRRVCRDGETGEPQRRCEDKNICEDVPYTDEVCSWVQVPRTRTVTKYRSETYYQQELRTRTVTKYRTETRSREVTKYRYETRTRQVTKYRTEQKCCQTQTRQVFDRQLQYNVTVQFPQNAVLIAGETELINVNLDSATLQTASVSINAINTIYGYKIIKQQTTGAQIYVELGLVPKFDINNAGENSIQNFRIDFNPSTQKFQVSFEDLIISNKIKNTYMVEVSDLATGQFIEKIQLSQINAKLFSGLVQANLSPAVKISAKLSVNRTGAIIANNGLAFSKITTFEKRNLTNNEIASLKDAKNVNLQYAGSGMNSALIVNDKTFDFADVKTEYTIYLDLITNGQSKPLNMGTFTREQIKLTQNAIRIVDILKNNAKAQQVLFPGQKISFDLIVMRKGTSPFVSTTPIKTTGVGSFIVQ